MNGGNEEVGGIEESSGVDMYHHVETNKEGQSTSVGDQEEDDLKHQIEATDGNNATRLLQTLDKGSGFSQFSKYGNVDSELFLLGGSNANTNVIVDDMSTMTIGHKLGSSCPMMEIRRLSIYIGKETTDLWSLIMTLKVCKEEIDASDCGPKDVPATPLVNALRYVVPTGRVVVPTGRYVVPAGKVIIIVSPGRLSLVPTGRAVKIYLEWDPTVFITVLFIAVTIQLGYYSSVTIHQKIELLFMASDGSDQDARYALSKLLQRGTVAEYESEFFMLIKRVTGIPKSLRKSFYISGLKPTLQCALLRSNPTTLDEAFSLARVAEARFTNQQLWELLRPYPLTLGEALFRARITEARFEDENNLAANTNVGDQEDLGVKDKQEVDDDTNNDDFGCSLPPHKGVALTVEEVVLENIKSDLKKDEDEQ
ncbi:hypothetical protein Tco_0604524, partial [Tanacetum coccineum]